MFFTGYSSVPGAPGNIAGNFLGSQGTAIRGAGRRPTGQPLLPGENPEAINQLYGSPAGTQQQMPSQPMLPQAFVPYAQNDSFTRFMNARKAIAARDAGFDNKTVS